MLSKRNSGIDLWNKAKKMIPGGSQLLSKRAEQFLPDLWPSYYKKAKGVEIWDLDGNKFVDMSLMGVGTCILGYSDDDVNRAAINAINEGTITTLNCPEEVELAETLLKLDPWAGMVRYARTGGEAVTIAVRIARAFSGKDKIAFCGYHGWHDWYIAANLSDQKNLDGHLLPGLDPAGVPRGLKGTSIPFHYNNIDELTAILEREADIGAIVMEPVRNIEPKDGFLTKVGKLADERGVALIFDEVTSGWRMTVGGIHKLYGVQPDIAVYGKAMANGFPMAAVVGKGEIMDAAQKSFISSSFWTERIGPAASIATINKMQHNDVPKHLCKIGNMVSDGWKKLGEKHDLKINVTGIPSLTSFGFDHPEKDAMHTLFTQEMLQRGFLASKAVYVSYSHTSENVKAYLENADDVFGLIKRAMDANNVHGLLKGPVAHSGFKRLN